MTDGPTGNHRTVPPTPQCPEHRRLEAMAELLANLAARVAALEEREVVKA